MKMKKNSGLKEFTHLVPCKRTPNSFVMKTKKKPKSGKFKESSSSGALHQKNVKKKFQKSPSSVPSKNKNAKKKFQTLFHPLL